MLQFVQDQLKVISSDNETRNVNSNVNIDSKIKIKIETDPNSPKGEFFNNPLINPETED